MDAPFNRCEAMAGRRLIVIVDGGPDGEQIAEWQRRALATLPPEDQLHLLVCTNTRLRRQPVKHGAYYLLNLLAARNPLTRKVPLSGIAAQIGGRQTFASLQDGAWQVLPDAIIEYIAASGTQTVIKLGMGLMRVPPGLAVPILSWHHGDPEHYRGRPAGFWELVQRRPIAGQIVQAIGNKLDAGAVLAFAETRVMPHGWRATLIESFRHSPLLLAPALDNALAGRSLAKPASGKNYRLPSNLTVARLALRLGWAKVRRLGYGLLFEKDWRVSLIPVADRNAAAAILTSAAPLPSESSWTTPPVPKGCTFVADPFFTTDGAGLLVEALSASSGRGELHRLDESSSTHLHTPPGHHSYPALVEQDGNAYCVPEIAQWSAPTVFRVSDQGLDSHQQLDIDGAPRLTDPTFLHHQGKLYLFANVAAEGSNVLRLWQADGLFSRFAEHPASPLRISPRGSRMGGNLVQTDGQLLRIGQDFTRDYGDGLVIFAIDELTPQTYREHEVASFRLADRSGPHTFNIAPDGTRVVIDWYCNRFTPLAGLRRLRARLRRN
jgi:hypothetical protein